MCPCRVKCPCSCLCFLGKCQSDILDSCIMTVRHHRLSLLQNKIIVCQQRPTKKKIAYFSVLSRLGLGHQFSLTTFLSCFLGQFLFYFLEFLKFITKLNFHKVNFHFLKKKIFLEAQSKPNIKKLLDWFKIVRLNPNSFFDRPKRIVIPSGIFFRGYNMCVLI